MTYKLYEGDITKYKKSGSVAFSTIAQQRDQPCFETPDPRIRSPASVLWP
jgi:hypothetical protein